MGFGDKIKDILGLPENEELDDDRGNTVEEQPQVRQRDRVSTGGSKMQFVLVKPEKYDECVQIGNHLLDKKTVVLNLEATGKDASRRIVDFLTGVAFALGGQIKKVSVATYIIVPTNADISGDVFDEIEGSGVFF